MPQPDEPMTFEDWWNGTQADDLRNLLRCPPTVEIKATYITLLAWTAWTRGERRQMHIDHKAEMQRLVATQYVNAGKGEPVPFELDEEYE